MLPMQNAAPLRKKAVANKLHCTIMPTPKNNNRLPYNMAACCK